MCWSCQGTMVLQESKAKSWWTICIADFDIETWSTSSTNFILIANKKMWAYKQALYIFWFLSIFYWNPSFKKNKNWISQWYYELCFPWVIKKKLPWCCYPNFISVLQFWSTLHATYFWATIFLGQKITSPCTKKPFSILCLHCHQGILFYVLEVWSLKWSLVLFPNETFSILCLHCPQGTLFYILHANGPWSHPLGFATCSLLKIPIAPMHPLSCSWWPHIFSFHIPCQNPTLLLTYVHGPNGKAMWISFWEKSLKSLETFIYR